MVELARLHLRHYLPSADSFWVRDRALALRSLYIPWFRKGTLAAIDQGLIAGSNFLLSILLARWLRPEQYGAFALAFAIFLLVAGVHRALVVEPMSVLGPAVYRNRGQGYLGVVLWIHLAVGLVIAAVLSLSTMVVGRVFSNADLADALAGLTLAAPCILLFWLAREACYLDLCPGPAAKGAFVYSALVLSGVLVVYRRGLLSTFVAFLLMMVCALAPSAILLHRLKPGIRQAAERGTCVQVWRRHWSYGRWELATLVVGWIADNIWYVLAGALLGMAEVGAFRAVANILLPAGHIALVLRRLFLPYVSGVSGELGHSAAKSPVKMIAFFSAIGALLYSSLATVFSKPILSILYGGKFMEFAYVVPAVGLCVVFSTAAQGLFLGLRAIQSPSSVFVASRTAAVVSILASVPGTWVFGLRGMVGAAMLSNLTLLIAAALLFQQKMHSLACASGKTE